MRRAIIAGAIAVIAALGSATSASADTYTGPCANRFQDATIDAAGHVSGYAAEHRLSDITLGTPVVVDEAGDTFTLTSATALEHRKITDSYITFGDAGIDVEHDTWSQQTVQIGVVSGPGAIASVTYCVALGNPTN